MSTYIHTLTCRFCGDGVTVSASDVSLIRGICLCTGRVTYMYPENEGVTECDGFRIIVTEESL